MNALGTHSLYTMQDGFRLSPCAMWDMWGLLSSVPNARFNQETLAAHDPQRTSLIALVVTEDGKTWIRDGLHRTAVIHMFGRTLLPDEYTVDEIPYAKFMEINLNKGWYTPFDPRTEVRRADFHHFKDMVEGLRYHYIDPMRYIQVHRADYCVVRRPEHSLDHYCAAMWNAWRDLQAAEEDWITK